MSFFYIKKNIALKRNYFLHSFILPILFLFPLFSSSVIVFNKDALLNKSIMSNSSISIDDEIKGIEEAIKAEELHQLDNNIDLKTKDSNKEYIKDFGLYKKSIIRVLTFGYHQIREIKPTDGPKTKVFITTPDIFEKEMKFLYDNDFHSISTTEYINYLKTGKSDFNINKSFIITFDDGYESQYINAFPILKKYGFTGTFFIYYDCIDKYPACMSSVQIKDLAANNMKIGNHTTHHAYLPKYSDKIIRDEILINKQKIINLVGTSSVENIFVYPYGATDQRIKDIVKSFDYEGAIGVLGVKNKEEKDIWNLRRYLLGEDYDFFKSLFKN
ncbi:MAG: polysaccharide deacetylase family protein [Candidatus Pacebacteria bacterium]|nr:polysaccharide deacetylase family protein [Candidatus Paceibacterota bacterium]